LWLAPLAFGLPAVLAYFALPAEAANVAYEGYGAVAALAVVAGVAIHRPPHRFLWLLVAAAFTLWTTADAISAVLAPDGGNVPVPSWADVAYYLGYLALIVGVGLLAGPLLHGSQMERPALLDAAIVATTASFPIWLFVIGPVLHAPGSTVLEALVTAGYPVLDVLVIAVIARHLLIEGDKPPAAVLLALALSTYLLADLANVAEALLDTYSAASVVNAGWLGGYVLAAAAVLHPSMATIGPRNEELRPLSMTRRALLLSAAVVPAGVIWLHESNDEIDRGVLAAGAAALVGLVLARLFGVLRDQQDLRAHVHHEARHDPLTGLANRKLFGERLDAAVSTTTAGIGLLYLDLNDFKQLNDRLGHDAGDDVLREVARRLSQGVRWSDDVARLGGDEFAILVPNAATPESVSVVAERVASALAVPATISGQTIRLSASIGVAWQVKDQLAGRELVRQADMAMYSVKARHRQNARPSQTESAWTVAAAR
jgi:diguanylate cyclase (GGDEF)-like protein